MLEFLEVLGEDAESIQASLCIYLKPTEQFLCSNLVCHEHLVF